MHSPIAIWWSSYNGYKMLYRREKTSVLHQSLHSILVRWVKVYIENQIFLFAGYFIINLSHESAYYFPFMVNIFDTQTRVWLNGFGFEYFCQVGLGLGFGFEYFGQVGLGLRFGFEFFSKVGLGLGLMGLGLNIQTRVWVLDSNPMGLHTSVWDPQM